MHSTIICDIQWVCKSYWSKLDLDTITWIFQTESDQLSSGTNCLIKHIEAETRWPPFSWHYQTHFFNESVWILTKISLKFVPMGPIYNIPALVLIMALAPTRRQAIIWTNDGLVYWRIYAPLGLNELMRMSYISRNSWIYEKMTGRVWYSRSVLRSWPALNTLLMSVRCAIEQSTYCYIASPEF